MGIYQFTCRAFLRRVALAQGIPAVQQNSAQRLRTNPHTQARRTHATCFAPDAPPNSKPEAPNACVAGFPSELVGDGRRPIVQPDQRSHAAGLAIATIGIETIALRDRAKIAADHARHAEALQTQARQCR